MADEGGVEVAADEGPHKALLLLETLDVILSHLDLESWKVARLVCRAWNDRALANFSKNRQLFLGDGGVSEMNSILTSADPRTVTSIFCCSPESTRVPFWQTVVECLFERLSSGNLLGGLSTLLLSGLSRQTVVECLFERLSSRNLLGGLSTLVLGGLDYGSFDHFIGVTNGGGLAGLKELNVWVGMPENEEDRYSFENIITPGVLPGLETLSLVVWTKSDSGEEELSRYKAGPLPAAFQAFIAAAPKIDFLKANVALDLSDLKVRKLSLNPVPGPDHEHGPLLATAAETSSMLGSVCGSLQYLKISAAPFPELCPLLPHLSKLKYVNVTMPAVLQLQQGKIFPALGKLELETSFDLIDWTQFPKLLPPTGKLREIKLLWEVGDLDFPAHRDSLDYSRQPLALLLNAELDRLTLIMNPGRCISELLCFLQTVEIAGREEEDKRLRRRILEISYAFEPGYLNCPPSCRNQGEQGLIRELTAVLEKLGGRWGRVRLTHFGFHNLGPPTWTKVEVPLYGGQKQGLIRVIPWKHTCKMFLTKSNYRIDLDVVASPSN